MAKKYLPQRWQPGDTPYAAFLKNLRDNDPEGYQAHLLERKQRKLIRNAMKEVVDAQRAKWIAMFHNSALKLLEKAVESGDAAAYAILHDRYIGKPAETINSDTNLILPWADDVTDTDTDTDTGETQVPIQ